MEKPRICISVRNLVEFILRSGDLDSRKGTVDKEAMLKGSRLHRKIQKQMGSNYRAEVSLKKETEYEDLILVVEGRADGILQEEDGAAIDEIKGIYADVDLLEKPVPVHRAQALCYARIYGEMEGQKEIVVQMTYANLDTEKVHRFRERISMEELENWYQGLTDAYHKWVSYQLQWKQIRNASMQGLEFPFPYREGQRKLVTSVYHSISEKKQIFVQAPTGIGKTMAVLFPAVRAVGEGKGETIFYLTAKTITRTVAEEGFGILREKGLSFKTITITAKEKLCFCEKAECNPNACPYAKGHFDRVNDAVFELWTTEESFDRNRILFQAEKWKVCPFEMCLDLAVWADGVICDYNYVFDPNAHLKRFFGEGSRGGYVFLIDEAHNLAERGREMYSASICKEEVQQVKRLIKPYSARLDRTLGKVNRLLMELKKEAGVCMVLENQGSLPLYLQQLMGEMDQLLEEPPEEGLEDEILDFYFSVRDFLNISELVDENYVVYSETGEDGKFRVRLFCVNPSENLKAYLEKGVSAVFFSATLLPMGYYRRLLSAREDDYGIYVSSPFEKEKRCILAGMDVSSRYTRRNYREYRKIAEYIARMAWQKKGNYMVFFPSYKLMEAVLEVYEAEFSVDWVHCISQTLSMDEREREAFLEEFREREETLVGFCVMGGLFSEGIDLRGKRLIGVAVVGTGLPQISNEREILKSFYEKKGENGFDYAYRFPGMNKVLQAAGRVIRTKEDRGVILILDDRFTTAAYQKLFPLEWDDVQRCRLQDVEKFLGEFWEKQKIIDVT